MNWLHSLLHHVGRYVNKTWYPLLVGFLAFIDTFIFVIPTDGLMISSAMSAPKRGWIIAVTTAIGSASSSVLFAWLLNHGVSFAEVTGPAWANDWFARHGVWALFGIAALPIVHHPVLVLACLAKVPIEEIGIAMMAGRLIKYGLYAYLCTHAPKLLMQSKHVQKEVHEVEEDFKEEPGDPPQDPSNGKPD